MKVSIVIEKDQHGYYAFAPELPGCQTQGETFEEADCSIREAISLYIETLSREEIEALGSMSVYTSTYDSVYA